MSWKPHNSRAVEIRKKNEAKPLQCIVKTLQQRIGAKGEKAALHYLRKKNYRIVMQNARFGRAEVDIIAETKDFVVFVEVKTRTTEAFGHPESFVTDNQKNCLFEAAASYSTKYETVKPIRYDIISIILSHNKTIIRHFEDAFWPMA